MWFFFFAFSMFMLPNSPACFLFWLGTEFPFLLDFFLSTRNLLPLLQLVLDRAGTLTRRIFPFNLLKLTRNGAAFLAKDSRKWLSYVCRTRFFSHVFSLSLAFTTLTMLSHCSMLFFPKHSIERSVFLRVVSAGFASINTGTNFVLFNCLYLRRPFFLGLRLPLAVWKSRLDHLNERSLEGFWFRREFFLSI